jgi:hypothetical protein
MAVKNLAARIDVKVCKDALFTSFLFNDNHGITDASLLTETSSATRTIANAAEESIPMGDITAGKVLFVKASRQVVIKITSSEGSEQAIICGPAAASSGALYLEGSFTAVSIENNSGVSAEVTAFVGGT